MRRVTEFKSLGVASWADVFGILFRSSGVQRDTLMEAFRDSADSAAGEERDDAPACMIYECFCCNCGFAAATRRSRRTVMNHVG